MTETRLKPKDQRLVYSGISWQEFKSIETGFAIAPGIRLFYYLVPAYCLLSTVLSIPPSPP
jgi:hypothetical protein